MSTTYIPMELRQNTKMELVMLWNIAEAEQQFAEVVKRAAEMPQVIYQCNMPVAVVINA